MSRTLALDCAYCPRMRWPCALMVPVSPRHAAKHETERRTWLRMEFATFCAAVIQMPCQIVKGGRASAHSE